MRKTSGDLHIVDFKSKRVIASLKPEDYFEDLRHWEIKDNADILDFKLLEDSPFLDYIQQHNLVLKETRPGVIVPYVITTTEKDSDAHTVTIYASGEWISLDRDNYLSPQTINSWSAEQYMSFATARNEWEVGIIEAVGKRSFVITEFTSPLKFIHEVASLFDNIEIQYRIVMNTNKPPTRYIDLVKKRGRETNKEITLGKDLLGVKRIENSENVITALVPFIMGKDDDGNEKMITIESVNNGLQYIVDEASYQRWNTNGKHLFGFYTPESENEDMTPARLLTLAKTELKKRVDTIVTYEVDSVDISHVFQYEHEQVNEGDTIHIIDEGMTPTLYLEARAIAGDESHKDPRQNKYTFGNFVEIVNQDDALRRLYQKMLAMINDKVPKEWFGDLEEKANDAINKANDAVEESQTAKDLANATKDYMDQNMVDIIEDVNPPTGELKPHKTLWLDISNGNPGILKIWNGTTWDIVVPDVEGIKRDLELTNETVKSKISEKQMQDYVGNLGTTNSLFNTAFEDRTIDSATGIVTQRNPSLTKWDARGTGIGATITATSSRNHEGYNSVQINNTGQTDAKFTSINQSVPIVADSGAYIFSVWAFTPSLSEIDEDGAIELTFRNGSTQVANKITYLKANLKEGVWTQLSIQLDAPTSAANVANVRMYIRKNGNVWFAQPMLQQGTSPSTFMENPKDMGNYDQMIEEIAKKVATSEFNSKVTTMETNIDQNTKAISLRAEKTEVYNMIDSDNRFGSKAIVERHESEIKLQAEEISLRVKSGDVASTINQTAQSVLIQADKIYLNGFIEAKHLKAQTLQGVTIQTAPSGSGANQIRLNAQNLTVYGYGRSRGYLGFIERTDGNIQSALVLGNDYETTGTLNGSLVIDQTTINSNVFTNSVASIGIATGRNGNDVTKSSYINFYRYDGAMQINSVGDMSLTNTNGNVNLTASSTGSTTGFITMSASKDIYFTAKRGYFNFYTSDNKSFPALVVKDLAPNTQGDVDITFANQIMFRVARHPDYVGDGLQIKSATGDAFRDIKLRTLRATENISALGRMYALEFVPTSTRKIKTNIEDLPFSALEKVNSVSIKCYNLISDVEKYNAGEIDALPVNYGMIAEDTDNVFTTPEKNAITLYSSVSISMQAIQEVDVKVNSVTESLRITDTRVDKLEKELEAQKLKEVDQDKRIAALEEAFQKLLNDAQTTKNTTQTEQP
ncbi:phage tail spike protein [Bacillus hominis]|uniref:phage tail spike protein n=1 Tax=Bacillus hominis TaxID=2817478 RepID=UPI0025A17381|nr:phage tail spike protein [Bacillus hominis]MDM5436159.1 phage tail spike protein [Bacillus hominis]